MKELAQFISTLSNPLFTISFVPFLIVYKTSSSISYALKWQLFSLVFIIVIGLFVTYGVLKGFFSNFDVSRRKQRPILYTFVALLLIFYFVATVILSGPLELILIITACLVGTIIFDIVNIYLKVSLHVASLTALLSSLILFYQDPWWVLGLILIPLVGWARIRTHRHSKNEVYVGVLAGSVITVLTYVVGKVFFVW